MANKLYEESDIQAIASAVRTKNGTQNTYTVNQIANAILAIPTGGGSTSYDWSEIGYSDEPVAIGDGFNYAKQVAQNWTQSTSYANKFSSNRYLMFMPLVDTSTGTNFSYMFSECHPLTTVPALDTSNGTNFSYMFNKCGALKEVGALNTGNGTNFSHMFYECFGLTDLPSTLDTSDGTDFGFMFYNCKSLTALPTLDTSNGTNFTWAFAWCSSLTTLPSLNTSNGTDFSYMFNNTTALRTIPLMDFSKAENINTMFLNNFSVNTFGGLADLGEAYSTSSAANYSNYTLNVSTLSSLTEQSLINILTNLYDIATKGCAVQKCTLGSDNIAKLTSSAGQAALIQAQNYGWTIS